MNTQNTKNLVSTMSKRCDAMAKMKSVILAFITDTLLIAYTLLVGKKIILDKIIFRVRYPEFTWDQPLLALAIGAVVALLLYFTPMSIGKYINGLLTRDENKSISSAPFMFLLYFILIISFVAGLSISQVSIKEFLSDSGINGAIRIFSALLNPNWAIIEDALFAAIETIYMAFIATSVALPFAFFLAFFAAKNLMEGSRFGMIVYTVTRFFLNISRSIEPLVWAIIFSVWVGIGPFSGMLALCIHSIAGLAKLYSEQIENINEGPIEAITATGANAIQIVWYGVVPQIILPYLSFTIYRWDINVRMATIIGLVGGGGIGTMLMQYQGLAKWNEVGLLVVIIATIVWVMDFASSKIRSAVK